MRRVALVFVLAVFVPSLVLAWLAVRSLRDQQFLIERQQSLLYQVVADARAKAVQDALADHQQAFVQQVMSLQGKGALREVARSFDVVLRRNWSLAQVGFVVTLTGEILAPAPFDPLEQRTFLTDNSRFLANRESVEVYSNAKLVYQNVSPASQPGAQVSVPDASNQGADRPTSFNRSQQIRNVIPQQQQKFPGQKAATADDNQQQASRLAPAEAEFRQLIGENNEGALARFVDNKLNVLFWCRLAGDPQLVFGAQLSLPRLIAGLQGVIGQLEPALREEICVALLDDTAKPVALSHSDFRTVWKRPFVATEIGETLPHWEIGVYLKDPERLARSARALKLTLGLLIGVLVTAIGIGSWLIVSDINSHLRLARQKTDFVSNVSHELKTPLTSIRMFSELLAEGRVQDPGKQRSYLEIITAEAARLTRLINNVLDFARLERGEKKYQFESCDLVGIVRETSEAYRPHLESNGFRFECRLPETAIPIQGDRDALAQVMVNLLSNAEKYCDSRREICIEVRQVANPLPHASVDVMDRGLGVPVGCEEKIFEQFYRAHDSLSSGIQGSGLGLTLARQMARAHGGEILFQRREGGGSSFSLRLPMPAGSHVP